MLVPVLSLLVLHGILGGIDVIFNHELRERLPGRLSAHTEEGLHALRELIFAMLFGALAWYEWHGVAAGVIFALIALEFCVTVWDTLVEDKTRKLSLTERTLHVFLFINLGAYTALLTPLLLAWWRSPAGLLMTHHGLLTWLLTGLAILALAWSLRDAASFFRLGRMKSLSLPG